MIEPDRWYLIRIRCEGPHYQVWLDETKVLDAIDSDNPILKGAVGLNAWGTQVEYRHLKVTALDTGKVLFQGLPTAQALVKAPPYWEFFGDGQFSWTPTNLSTTAPRSGSGAMSSPARAACARGRSR